ncbi:restriction endonuclease subunit S [Sphingomonas sp. Leaf25]|uniref:restriction endonuclease subunit S n=1 Tax=Sphingomonas sp. Leaf25 TaxID=1735692 RepID=UPI000AFA5BD4|nr:restriction endonuclease subunit S [Sphingomonas sp. Leaf25]
MTPILRFPQFKDAWQPRHGDDAFRSRRQRATGGLPLYSVTMDQGMVRRDSLEREFASSASDEANLRVFKDDHVYNMMRMWQGAVGRAPEDCMVSPAYVVLQPKSDTVPAFFDHWFKRKRSVYLLWAYSYGLTNDRLRLYARDFGRVPMALPTVGEQRKVADFLSTIDERLKLLRRRQDALTRYKVGVVERLFCQSLRFTRDDGARYPNWREVRFGDIATFAKGRGISKDDIATDGDVPCIRYGELYTAYSERIDRVISKTNAPCNTLLLSKKDDVILPASGEAPLDMASASCVTLSGVALGGDINIIRSSLDGVFLAYLLRGPLRRSIARLAQGNSVVHVYGSHLACLKFYVPTDLDEQRKIAAFLGGLDSKITAISAQIKQMQVFKKALLQQMFV